MKSIPRIRFAHLPTPIESLSRLSSVLGGPKLLIKRDDQTGLAMGGNKARKLEFLLAEAQIEGANTLITAGAIQSNHCRQTAAAAARFGFNCILVLFSPLKSKRESTEQTINGNLLIDRLMGANIVWCERSELDTTLQNTFSKALDTGLKPYLIPYGGSNPIGATGYVFAMQELMEQGEPPDWIVFPSSSGGTQAGLILGSKLFNYPGKILGVSVDKAEIDLREHVLSLVNQTADFLDENSTFVLQDILVDANYVGGGYGVMGTAEIEAIQLFAQYEGILLDPVYTGKAAAGLIDLIRTDYFKSSEKVLFWHTGGTPVIFAETYQTMLSREVFG